jgi:hypothetical protein
MPARNVIFCVLLRMSDLRACLERDYRGKLEDDCLDRTCNMTDTIMTVTCGQLHICDLCPYDTPCNASPSDTQ